jgi:hypothetical protein
MTVLNGLKIMVGGAPVPQQFADEIGAALLQTRLPVSTVGYTWIEPQSKRRF